MICTQAVKSQSLSPPFSTVIPEPQSPWSLSWQPHAQVGASPSLLSLWPCIDLNFLVHKMATVQHMPSGLVCFFLPLTNIYSASTLSQCC